MTDYSTLDDQIVAYVMAGCNEFWEIVKPLRKEAEAMALPDRYGIRAGWRVIDRRLQALRKKGALVYDRKTGWRVA